MSFVDFCKISFVLREVSQDNSRQLLREGEHHIMRVGCLLNGYYFPQQVLLLPSILRRKNKNESDTDVHFVKIRGNS